MSDYEARAAQLAAERASWRDLDDEEERTVNRRAVEAMVAAGEAELEAECQSWHAQVPADSFCSVCHWSPRDELAARTLAELGAPARQLELPRS